jgi:hypothetical protein
VARVGFNFFSAAKVIFDGDKNRWNYFVNPNFFSAAKVIFDGDKDRWNYFVNPRLATK